MISSVFLRKGLQNDKKTTGFIRVWGVISPMVQNVVFLMVFLVFWESMGAQELFPRIAFQKQLSF